MRCVAVLFHSDTELLAESLSALTLSSAAAAHCDGALSAWLQPRLNRDFQSDALARETTNERVGLLDQADSFRIFDFCGQTCCQP
jgi:hypothetical protein